MRHRKQRRKLSMRRSQRKATLKNMARSLIEYQRIETTLARAKEIRRVVEPLITIAKNDTIAARRQAYRVLAERDLVVKLFKDIAPLFKGRNGGYTRIIPLGFRRGDGAQLAILELTERKIEEKIAKKKKEKAKEAEPKEGAARGVKAQPVHEQASGKVRGPKAEDVEAGEVVSSEVAPEVATKKEEPKAKPVPRSKPTSEEEKKAERAKAEEKSVKDKKGFVKNLRGFFHRKSDT